MSLCVLARLRRRIVMCLQNVCSLFSPTQGIINLLSYITFNGATIPYTFRRHTSEECLRGGGGGMQHTSWASSPVSRPPVEQTAQRHRRPLRWSRSRERAVRSATNSATRCHHSVVYVIRHTERRRELLHVARCSADP